MAFVIGHSQTKYLCEYLCPGAFTVFSYPGAQTMDFVTKEEIFEVVPFFSRVVLVVGANDIGRKTPDQIVEEIELLCEQIKIASPSAIVWVSAVLPRVQNSFHGCQMNLTYLQRWNQDAIEINIKLRQLSSRTPWLDIIEHPDFHSLFGGNRQLIGRDGLHLNSDGHEALARDIEVSIQHFGAQTTQPVVVPDKRQETLSLFVGPQRYSDVIRSKVRSKVTGSPAVSRSKVTGSPAVSRSKVTGSPAVGRSKVTGSPAVGRSKVTGSPAVSRSKVTGSPTICRSKVTGSPAVSRSKVTRSPAVSRSKVTGSPAVGRSKVTGSPAVGRSKVTGSPAVSRSKVTGSPTICRSKVTGSPAVSRSKVTRSPAVSRSKVTGSPAISRSKVKGSPAVGRSEVTGSPAVSRSKVTGSPTICRSKVTGSPAISRSKVKGSPAVSRSKVKGSPAVGRSEVTRSPIVVTPEATRSKVRRQRAVLQPVTVIETVDKFILSTDSTGLMLEKQRGGGPVTSVFMNKINALSVNEVVSIFNDCVEGKHMDRICLSIPSDPVGGDVYVFDTTCLSNAKDFRVDKYVWFNDGRKKYPRNKPAIVYKTINKIRMQDKTYSNKFMKHIYEHVENNKYVVVHYLGDETVYMPVSHGNSKDPTKEFRRTCPSVFDEIKTKSRDITKTCTEVEKESKANAKCGTDLGIKTAKNVEQVKNHFYKARKESKLSHDSLYNLCALSYELDNFNKQIDVYPSLVCISAYDDIVKEFNNLLLYDHCTPIKMFYDTTYELSGLFVSVLSYQHIIFEGNRIIPVAFMLHEKRDAKFHERFFRVLAEHIPNLMKTNSPFICDREAGIKKAITSVFPNIPVLHCWNHIKNDVKVWVKKHNGKQDDISAYANDVNEILFSESEDDCLNRIKTLEQKWSEAFRTYFHRYIKSAIIENAGQWILQKLKVFNPYSGITNNAAESVNNMIKAVQKYKELPIDFLCLHLFYLQQSIFTDIQCSRAGFGNYKLKPEFDFAKLDTTDIKMPAFRGTPTDILEQVKQKIKEFEDTNANTAVINHKDVTDSDEPNEIIKNCQNKCSGTDEDDNSDFSNILKDKNATTIDDKSMTERKGQEKNLSQQALAKHVIENDLIKYVSSMNSFMVEGIKGTKRVVTLQPTESCSCPSTGQCYHLIAVKQSLNIDLSCKNKTIKNLSILRKNAKPRIARKTGQKQPRKTDFEVIPAPDSLAALKCSTPVRDAQTPVCMSANTTINLTPVTPHTEHNQVIKSSLKKRKSTLTDTKAKKKIKFETNINTNDNMSTIVEEILEEESLIALPDAEPRSHILLNSDIDDIINEKAWLNDKVINFCQNLIKSNGNVNGMQDTLYAPSFDDSKQKWKVNEKFKKQSAPCCQIHFNGNGHWVASYQKEVNGTVYVLDSLKSNRTVNANLIIQISQMYKCEANYIDVLVPEVQRQNNSSDCGVFAIAFITELVLNKFEIDISNIRFIGTKMREHLLKCVQDKNIVVFPKVKKMPKMPCKEPKKLKIKLYCSCKMPDIIDDMVQCENKSCGKWYHKKCVSEITNEWLCNSCSW